MSLFLITGTSGTGKSAVCRVLKDRGYEAYDIDDDGLARWQNDQTGYIHPKSSVKPAQRTPEFIAAHTWVVPRERLEELARNSGDSPVFICGSLGSADRDRDLFEKMIALYVDDDTLVHRLTTRTSNDWGKQPHELEQSLRHHHAIYDTHRAMGGIVIDAAQPVENVVDDILLVALKKED